MLHSIKNFIKSNSITKYLYSKVQCYIVLAQYSIIKIQYKYKKEQIITQSKKTINITKKINVFYFGGDELQDKSGFIQALSENVNLTYFSKENGEYGSYNFGVLNRKKNIKFNKKRLFELLNKLANTPDILLMQTWEWRIGLTTLVELKSKYPDMKIVNIAMDDRHSFWVYGIKSLGTAGLIPILDYVFTTSSEAVQWYKKEGCKAFFYPLASDENIFKPLKIKKQYDIGFVGAKYGIRELIVERLLEKGINVKAYGNGWSSGRLPIDDTNKFYNQCKIVLGVGTILGCDKFVSMKLRDFDVPMSGSVYITNYNTDTAKIFIDNEEIIYYKNIDECIDKIITLLNDDNILDKIRKKTLIKSKKHTYNIRIKEMLNQIGYRL